MISYKGKVGILVAFPVFVQVLGILDIPGLTAQVAALANLVANFKPPTVAAGLTFAANLLAQINATVSYPVLQISAELVAKLALLKVRLELALKIADLVASGSVRLYEQEGTAGTFGPEWTAQLASADADGGIAASQSTYSILLVAEAGTAGATTLKTLRSGV